VCDTAWVDGGEEAWREGYEVAHAHVIFAFCLASSYIDFKKYKDYVPLDNIKSFLLTLLCNHVRQCT